MEASKYSDWLPRELFLRAIRTVRAGGIPWTLYYDGYWEPSDPERKGLEIGVTINLDQPVLIAKLDKVIANGFLERMDEDFRRMGFDVKRREHPRVNPRKEPDSKARTYKGYLTFYYKYVLRADDFLRESRRLLKCTPVQLI